MCTSLSPAPRHTHILGTTHLPYLFLSTYIMFYIRHVEIVEIVKNKWFYMQRAFSVFQLPTPIMMNDDDADDDDGDGENYKTKSISWKKVYVLIFFPYFPIFHNSFSSSNKSIVTVCLWPVSDRIEIYPLRCSRKRSNVICDLKASCWWECKGRGNLCRWNWITQWLPHSAAIPLD